MEVPEGEEEEDQEPVEQEEDFQCVVYFWEVSLWTWGGGSGVVIKVPEGEGKEYQEPVEQAEDFQCVVYFWEVGLWTWGRGGSH